MMKIALLALIGFTSAVRMTTQNKSMARQEDEYLPEGISYAVDR